MAKLLALYNKPANPAAFDSYYYSTHVPLAKKVPGLRSYEVNVGPVLTPQGPADVHLAAVLSFDSLEAMKHGMDSPPGQAAAADLGNFAQAGVQLLMFDTREI